MAQPQLQIQGTAEAADWLRDTAGTGPLAGLFRRNHVIVHAPRIGEDGYVPAAEGHDDGQAQVRPVGTDDLQARVQFTYRCWRRKEAPSGAVTEVRALFPRDAARLVCAAPDMLTNLRALNGVIHVPIPRSDGSIITEPGYDEATGLLYLPEDGLTVEVPERPTAKQTSAARDLLLQMVAGFDFASEHDLANYLGFLLTPLLREIVPPPYKLTAIGAPQPGSGKSLLATVARTIHGGVFRSELPGDEAELDKSLTGILLHTTGPVVVFDNVTGTLRSSRLAGLLTSTEYGGRVLGSTNETKMANDRAWCVTGNNLSLGGDLVRRTIQVTIDPGCPNPEERTGFAISDLKGWTREHRAELVSALLTLVRSWAVAGRPARGKAGSDDYWQWIEAVDGILGHAGIPGSFDHKDARRVTVGADDEEWSEFLEAVHSEFGTGSWTVKEMLAKVADPPSGPEADSWASQQGRSIPLDALPTELGEKVTKARGMGAGVISKSLGRWLLNREGRWAGDRITVRSAGKDSRMKTMRWRIELLAQITPELRVAGS